MLAIIWRQRPDHAVHPTFRTAVVRTPYGEASGALVFGQICGKPAVSCRAMAAAIRFRRTGQLLRQSVGLAPSTRSAHHFRRLGRWIRGDLHPGISFAQIQIIDYTWGRNSTFF